jgi:hypothetical protein
MRRATWESRAPSRTEAWMGDMWSRASSNNVTHEKVRVASKAGVERCMGVVVYEKAGFWAKVRWG